MLFFCSISNVSQDALPGVSPAVAATGIITEGEEVLPPWTPNSSCSSVLYSQLLAISCGHGRHMQRREFIALVSSVAVWPLETFGQQATMPVIGFLNAGSPEEHGPK